jgi:hypothetical protein
LTWKLALAWAGVSIVWLLVIGLLPTEAGGTDCGSLFAGQPLVTTGSATACEDQRSLLRLPAAGAAGNLGLALVVAFFAYAQASAPRARQVRTDPEG